MAIKRKPNESEYSLESVMEELKTLRAMVENKFGVIKEEKRKNVGNLLGFVVGTRFKRYGTIVNFTYIKVYPRMFLQNSTLLSDLVNRGYCLAVNLNNGSLLPIPGSEVVELVTKESE